MVGLGLVLLLAAGTAGIGLRALADRYDRSVLRGPLLDPAARREHASTSGPLNYLLVGSDQRTGSPSTDERSDTIMIMHVPAGLDRAYLISVPRDLLVDIPQSRATGYEGGSDKINSAFYHGGGGQAGSQLLSATLAQVTGLRFDGAALIDFSGFSRVVDLLGGVQMCVEAEVHSIHTGTVFKPGCRQMTGGQALDFARQRYDLPNGDFDRQRHQQQLLKAIIGKIVSDNLWTKPAKLDQVIRAIGSSLTMDTNGLHIENLIFSLRGLRSDALVGVQVPSYPEEIDDTSYVVLDDSARGLFDSLHGPDLENWLRANPKWVNRI
jgi:LCP family protein required for cell wall assembly